MFRRQFSFFRLILAITLFSATTIVFGDNNNNSSIYLYKPTGNFQVSFNDYHWINNHVCPDPTAPANVAKYFSQGNAKFCRELMVRVYYPTKHATTIPSSSYPADMIDSLKQSLLTIEQPVLKSYIAQHINELSQVKVYAQGGLPIVNQEFPVIIFSPGATDNSNEYTNLFINLAAHGYIVIAINDTFLTDVTLSNGVVVPANPDLTSIKLIRTLYNMKYVDMNFVYNKMLTMHKQDAIFQHMNLNQIGLLGHSAGASAVVAMANLYPNKIQAVVALDAPNQTDSTTNPNLRKANIVFPIMFDVFDGFKMPFMQIHSSNAQDFLSVPNSEIKLLPQNFLVSISPTPYDKNYFKHMDFTDYTLFKDLPFIEHINQYYSSKHLDNPVYPNSIFGTVSGKVAIDTDYEYLDAFFNAFLRRQQSQVFDHCVSMTSDSKMICAK